MKEQKRDKMEYNKKLVFNAFALSERTIDNMPTPRVSLRLPWAMRLLGFQPVFT